MSTKDSRLSLFPLAVAVLGALIILAGVLGVPADPAKRGTLLPDGHPCFYVALYRDSAGIWFVDDERARLAGPFPTEHKADSARESICRARIRQAARKPR